MIIVKLVVLGIVCVCAWLTIKALGKGMVSADDGSVLLSIALVIMTSVFAILLFFAHW